MGAYAEKINDMTPETREQVLALAKKLHIGMDAKCGRVPFGKESALELACKLIYHIVDGNKEKR